MKKIERKLMGFLMVISLFLPMAAAVTCGGCTQSGNYRTDGTDAWQTFQVKEGSRITLSDGKDNCNWVQNQQNVSDNSELDFYAGQDSEYTLVCHNASGAITSNFTATIEINELSSCVPKRMSEIKLNGDEFGKDATIKVVPGEKLDFDIDVLRGCPNYQVLWTSNPPEAITFDNPGSLATRAHVAADYSGKNPVITVTITAENGNIGWQQTTKLLVSKNTPPKVEAKITPPIQSYTSLDVSLEGSTSGKSGNEDTDYIAEIEVWLKDSHGKLVDSDRKTMDREKPLPVLSLTPTERESYTVVVQITDSYGATTEKTIGVLVAEKGDTNRDKLTISVRSEMTVNTGEYFQIPIEYDRDEDISVEYFYNGKTLVSPFKFSVPGDYKITVVATSFDWDTKRKTKEISETVLVHAVSKDLVAAPSAAVSQIPPEKELEPKESPLGITPMVGLFITLAIARRRGRTPKS